MRFKEEFEHFGSPSKLEVKRVTLEKVTQYASRYVEEFNLYDNSLTMVGRDMINSERYFDTIAFTLVRDIAKQKCEPIEVKVQVSHPTDWWESFKERWYPSWLLTRYPVKYKMITCSKTIGADVFYPQIAVPEHQNFIQMYVKE